MSRSTSRYHAVLFDAGNTLLRVQPSVGEIYAGVAGRYGVAADPATIERHFRQVFAERDGDLENYTSEEAEQEWWRRVVQTVFERAGFLAEFDGQFEAYFSELNALFLGGEVWHVFDDVTPTLDTLRAMGLRCAVASNWDSRLPAILNNLKLDDWFEFVLTSSAVGRSKPHPLLFERALERFGLSAEQVVYVGDSYPHDVVGATRAGLTPLLLDRHAAEATDQNVLRSLADLPAWLKSHAEKG